MPKIKNNIRIKKWPKKQFGQNFLTNKTIVNRMVETALIKEADIVLEIGAGKGVLTEELLKSGARVLAVEKDRDLIPELKERFSEKIKNEKLILIEKDIRDINLKNYKFKNGKWKLVANIPYYITGEILRRFLENKIQPSLMVLMVQKEVGQRIVARDGKESILSISVKVYGKATLVSYVSRGNFTPSPNVDSAIISISNINKNFFKGFSEKKFFEILRTGFAHKRKFLFSNLSILFSVDKLRKSFKKANIPLNIRGEDLSLSQWGELSLLL